MPSNDRRWMYAVPLLAIAGAVLMVALCRYVNRGVAEATMHDWMAADLSNLVPTYHRIRFEHLAHHAAGSAKRVADLGAEGLRRPGPDPETGEFVALLTAQGRVAESSEPACWQALADLHSQIVAGRPRAFLVCDGKVAMVAAAPVEGLAGWFAVEGQILGDQQILDLKRLTRGEVMLLGSARVYLTSFRDPNGQPLDVELPAAFERSLAAGEAGFTTAMLTAPAPEGFTAREGVFGLGAKARFFLAGIALPETVPPGALRVVLAVPTALSNAATDRLTLLQAAGALAIAMALGVIVVRLFAAQAKPLYQLRAATARVAEGDFSVEVPVTGRGESARAASAFNAMVGRLRETNQRLANIDKLASMGTLAAGVAHEINNPLAFVTSNLDFIHDELVRLESPLDQVDGLREALQDATDGAARIGAIVRDMRLFSGPREESNGAVDVCSVLDSSINLASNQLRQKARVVRDYGAVPLVAGSPQRLGQVFLNLLVNAAQAIKVGSPDTDVVQVRALTERGRVVVEITDTGEGIPPENMKRLFDPFFTTKPIGVGTGLGLSICHGIVSALGGAMEVESQLGAGSTFRVILPRAEDPAAAAAWGTSRPRAG